MGHFSDRMIREAEARENGVDLDCRPRTNPERLRLARMYLTDMERYERSGDERTVAWSRERKAELLAEIAQLEKRMMAHATDDGRAA